MGTKSNTRGKISDQRLGKSSLSLGKLKRRTEEHKFDFYANGLSFLLICTDTRWTDQMNGVNSMDKGTFNLEAWNCYWLNFNENGTDQNHCISDKNCVLLWRAFFALSPLGLARVLSVQGQNGWVQTLKCNLLYLL